jgi:hypothetical protein
MGPSLHTDNPRTCIDVDGQVLKQKRYAILNAVDDLVYVLGLALLHNNKAGSRLPVLDPLDTLRSKTRSCECRKAVSAAAVKMLTASLTQGCSLPCVETAVHTVVSCIAESVGQVR